jgi:hypothetical protein
MMQPPSLLGPAIRRGGRGSIKLASDIGRIVNRNEVKARAEKERRWQLPRIDIRYSCSFLSRAHLRTRHCQSGSPLRPGPNAPSLLQTCPAQEQNPLPATPSRHHLHSLPDRLPTNTPSCDNPDRPRESATTPRRIQFNSTPPVAQVLPTSRTLAYSATRLRL